MPTCVQLCPVLQVRNFKKSLIGMYDGKGQHPVFMETVVRLNQFRHTYLECIPVANEDAEIFFYHELDRSESVVCAVGISPQ